MICPIKVVAKSVTLLPIVSLVTVFGIFFSGSLNCKIIILIIHELKINRCFNLLQLFLEAVPRLGSFAVIGQEKRVDHTELRYSSAF